MGLRTNQGINKGLLEKSNLVNQMKPILTKWGNYLNISNNKICIKPKYYHMADEIISDLLV